MPIELTAPMPVQVPAVAPLPILVIEKRTVVFLGQLLAVCVLAGVWVGIQSAYLGAVPSDAQQSIAGP